MEHPQNRLSFIKAKEIEDFIDLNFYHPLGYYLALFFNSLGFSPNLVSFISMIVGIVGSIFIYKLNLICGSLLIILASVIDSADGQVARMSGKTSPYGRIIDGLVGYIIFTSVYLAIALRYKPIYGYKIFLLMIIAGISNILHSNTYDFYRTAYLCVIKNRYDEMVVSDLKDNGFFRRIYSIYISIWKIILNSHMLFINSLKNGDIRLTEDKLAFYKKKMLSNIHFINLLGDNWRINGILFLSLFNRLDLYFYYIIFFMNALFIFVVLRQKKIDEEILREAGL